ncbi:hypothetical protein BD779DRAFT_1441132 [Infundibulicybe gibba]|nr:hypothetical protein BD779DRAFT_1441132 [Infundibulicybe gibba]
MSISQGPGAQNALFDNSQEHVPSHLARANFRLEFPPSYAIVGVYRFCTDKLLYVPAWDKCRHATRRGVIVGVIWSLLTFKLQKGFIEIFLSNSPRVTGLSNDTLFGFKVPFNIHTYAAVLFLGSQVTYILKFFLFKNIRIARERAWNQTMVSRGKGPDFWKPYVEEWDNPPPVSDPLRYKWLGGSAGLFLINVVILLIPFGFYPVIGIILAAWFKALGTSHNLHRQYFASKKMTEREVAVFMEERKWDYRTFGFTAALLEGLPIIGLVFTISNRVGAAMWAHDLEKRQHFVASERMGGAVRDMRE